MKVFLRGLSAVYLLLLALSLTGMRFIGEHHVLTATLLFLPLVVWIFPAAGLLLLGAIWDRFLSLVLAGLMAWYGFFFMAPEFNDWIDRKEGDLTLLSCNLGRDSLDGLQRFVGSEDPDVIALQEVNNRRAEVRQGFSGYKFSGIDQFPLLSRYPILEGRSISLGVKNRRDPCAGRYEVDYNGRRIVIFNVHLPTPRRLLASAWQQPRVLLPEIFVKEYPELCKRVVRGWEDRVSQIDELISILKKERHPVIVAGDFNMPAHGTSYPKMANFMIDAFTVRGRGFGFTFPGNAKLPESIIAPWLRLDYQFVSPEWSTGYFGLEPTRGAQHRATVARFRLRDAIKLNLE